MREKEREKEEEEEGRKLFRGCLVPVGPAWAVQVGRHRPGRAGWPW